MYDFEWKLSWQKQTGTVYEYWILPLVVLLFKNIEKFVL